MPRWRNNQAFVLHMSRGTLLFLRGVANPLVFIKRPYSVYLVSSSWWVLQRSFIVRQSGLFRADYPKHVSSLRGLDGPFCHSVSKPAVQSLLCTELKYQINTYGNKSSFFLLNIYFFYTMCKAAKTIPADNWGLKFVWQGCDLWYFITLLYKIIMICKQSLSVSGSLDV